MIGLILGTSEGRRIVSLLNEFTDDLLVSTATAYGGELLKDLRYRAINTAPLKLQALIELLRDNKVKTLIDASHPYAEEITRNALEACRALDIEYIRYERPSILDTCTYEKLIRVSSYGELEDALKCVEGTILNTTGSRNLERIMSLKLPNRVVHRVLPGVDVMEKCFKCGVRVDDIIAVKGPASEELNKAFIREYDAKAIIMKDSGPQGGTEEKLRAARELGIYVVLIEREKKEYMRGFSSEEELVKYVQTRKDRLR